MKILKEERERIQKLYGINEMYDGGEIDNPDETSDFDANMDEEIEKMFFDCLNQIEDMRGGKLEKSEFIRMLDKYYGDEPEVPEEELPFR